MPRLMTRLVLYEDQFARNFSPLSLLRPVFEMMCGHYTLRDRLVRNLQISEWGAFLRDELIETYLEDHPECKANDIEWLKLGSSLAVNGRYLPTIGELEQLQPNQAILSNGTIVAMYVKPEESVLFTSEQCQEAMNDLSQHRDVIEGEGVLLNYPWDLIAHNGEQIIRDYADRADAWENYKLREHLAIVGDPKEVSIDPSAHLDPYVAIDARMGPVTIGPGANVQAFTRIEGPCYIGAESHLFRANIREGTTLGRLCKVSGEVEESILHGYLNKAHDGFLGHSYLCPWVNLGALTSNSDLKNDYSAVRIPVDGKMINSGKTKMGCLIGDHTKTAIGSLFNTGSSVGVMSMILPGGGLLPKHIPSFCRIWHGKLEELDPIDIEKSCETAKIAMGRRNIEFTLAQERLIRRTYQLHYSERESAVDYERKKQKNKQNSLSRF